MILLCDRFEDTGKSFKEGKKCQTIDRTDEIPMNLLINGLINIITTGENFDFMFYSNVIVQSGEQTMVLNLQYLLL